MVIKGYYSCRCLQSTQPKIRGYSAVKAQQFHLWIVEDAAQALQILLQRDLIEMPDKTYHADNRPLNQLILQNIEDKNQNINQLVQSGFPG